MPYVEYRALKRRFDGSARRGRRSATIAATSGVKGRSDDRTPAVSRADQGLSPKRNARVADKAAALEPAHIVLGHAIAVGVHGAEV
jgi:hypothetical protein